MVVLPLSQVWLIASAGGGRVFFLVVGGRNSKDVCSLAYDITHMWNLILKNYTNELLYKTETDVQISKTKLTDNEKAFPEGEMG